MTRSQCKVSDTQVTVKACGSLVLIVTKLGTVMVLESIFSLLGFRSHGQRSRSNVLVKIKLLFFIPSFVLKSQYIMIVLPYIYKTSYNVCIRGQEDFFCISGHMVKGHGQICFNYELFV